MRDLNQPTDDELAAAFAAISLLLDEEQATSETGIDTWHASAKLSPLNLRPARVGIPVAWRTTERLRAQARGGLFGVTGL